MFNAPWRLRISPKPTRTVRHGTGIGTRSGMFGGGRESRPSSLFRPNCTYRPYALGAITGATLLLISFINSVSTGLFASPGGVPSARPWVTALASTRPALQLEFCPATPGRFILVRCGAAAVEGVPHSEC